MKHKKSFGHEGTYSLYKNSIRLLPSTLYRGTLIPCLFQTPCLYHPRVHIIPAYQVVRIIEKDFILPSLKNYLKKLNCSLVRLTG